ncbi:MAG: restriction endonuclease subunit R, partial [Prevotellaceae bacterium]|nr:restriction endonuclease subunit R [Prevotellaceae bacterium]
NNNYCERPDYLLNKNAANAFYGINLENFKRLFPELPVKEMALATTKVFDNIIRNAVITDDTVIVDWQANFDIIGRIKICLEDELFDNVKSKYGVDFPFNDMDMIIDGCVDVAKIWIR